MTRLTIIAALVLALSGCAGVRLNYDRGFCDLGQYVPLARADIKTMRAQTLRAIVKNNELGEKLCGWKPPAH